ncbi:MAG TPA: AsmA-like C-terminal region-containing protein, partial [Isosphaeraceae bacterium]|nr:AsmA-like C-terminal region-containing protein [Isosphaeraceae bacterium]
TPDDMKAYTARGTADLAGASISGLDLGRLRARLDLVGGVLEISDLRGRLVDRAEARGRPQATEPPPATGPLPPGGFRGRVRAELAADRDLHIDIEGVELPLGELLAVAPIRELPLSGRLTIQAAAAARGNSLADPRAWTLSGRAEMPEASYQEIVIRDLRTSLAIRRGRLTLPDLTARVGDSRLTGRLGIDLAEPWAYEAELDAGRLSCHDLLALIPHGSDPVHVAGTIAGRGAASGTLRPWRLESTGEARIGGLQVGRMTIGDLPLRWTTQGETITLTAQELQRYGGRISAEARVPVRGDRPIEGTIDLARVDTAQLSAEAPESLHLTGRADGQARFRWRPWSGGAGPPLEGQARLTAADLRVRAIPTRSVTMTLTVRDGVPKFDIQAETLGGTIQLAGDGHVGSELKDDEVHAELRATGVQLLELWEALGTSGALAKLEGTGSLSGRFQTHASLNDLRAQGTSELRNLGWGFNNWLGSLRAGLEIAPEGWRIGPVGGELWGGRVEGDGIRFERIGGGRSRYGIDLGLEGIMLPRALAFWPEADRRFAGAGRLKIQGRSEDSLRGTAEFRVDRGRVNGLELTELRIPAAWDFQPGESGRGQLRIRQAIGKLAGGRIGGDAWVALGDRRDFHARLFVDDVDLRVVSREELANRPMPGQLSGFATLSGPDPLQLSGYRGELDFDLVQASLLDIPLLDELDRSLGSAQGGVFDAGDMHGTIADRKITIDHLTLVGPLAQVHASGSVDFDGRLNLEVVANTNKELYEASQAVLLRAPNVANAVASQSEAINRVSALLSRRLLTFRITGTIRDPVAHFDRSVNVRAAIGFFFRAMRLSLRR